MNAVFCAVFIISAALLAATAPEEFLSSLLGGARSAAQVALTLFCVYAVWMGLANVAESSGITKKTAKLFRPLCAKIFKTDSNDACEEAAMNLTCDLLGAGASTPFAVKAMAEFEKESNAYAQKLLFIINAAGFQLIPSTVIALRAGYGSAAAADIFLPSLACSFITLALSVFLYVISEKALANVRRKRGAGRRSSKGARRATLTRAAGCRREG